MASEDKSSCLNGFCFFQGQFASIILFVTLIITFVLAILVMHFFKDDGDIVWVQGIVGSVLAAFLVSLKASSGQHQGDTIKTGDNTTVNVPKPSDAQPIADTGKAE